MLVAKADFEHEVGFAVIVGVDDAAFADALLIAVVATVELTVVAAAVKVIDFEVGFEDLFDHQIK